MHHILFEQVAIMATFRALCILRECLNSPGIITIHMDLPFA
jgi:hypothetical protein